MCEGPSALGVGVGGGLLGELLGEVVRLVGAALGGADALVGELRVRAGGLLALPADSAIVYTANSQNFTTPASRPVITVTAAGVPEPGTTGLLLAGVGVGFQGGRRWRKRWKTTT